MSTADARRPRARCTPRSPTRPPPARPRVLLVGHRAGLRRHGHGLRRPDRGLRRDSGPPARRPGCPRAWSSRSRRPTWPRSPCSCRWSPSTGRSTRSRNDDRPNAYVALGLTLVLGLAYVNSAVYLFTQMGAAIARSVPELLLFAVGGFHIATIAVGMVFVALMAFRALGGQYSGRDSEGIAAAAVFWDATVAVYSCLVRRLRDQVGAHGWYRLSPVLRPRRPRPPRGRRVRPGQRW